MNGSVLMAAQVADESLRAVVGERVAALHSFYAPLGIVSEERGWYPALRLIAERISFAHSHDSERLWTWGERLPDDLCEANALLFAAPDDLRAIQGMTAAFAFGRDRARLVSSPSGPATLYEAQGDGVWCCSTHAVAAAWVAHGDARVDPATVPELLAFDFVGGERTLVEGARHLPPATDISINPTGHGRSTWVMPAERWEPVPEDEAQAHAEAGLLASLPNRLDGARVELALTAGLDSRVIAVALHEAGIAFKSFTWGEQNWPDTQGAAAVAGTLGATHSVLPSPPLAPALLMAEHDRAARWSDGVFALAASARTWPHGADAVASGMGGETGRAFYYDDWSTWLWPEPRRSVLADRLSGRAHLPAANGDAVRQADASVSSWLDEAESTGASGWRLLDVVYAEQRVRRWGRGQVPCGGCAFTPGFVPYDLARALVSQPLSDRLRSRFHHRFLEARRPDLALPTDPAPSMPSPSTRAAQRARHRYRRARGLRKPQPQAGDEFVAHVWAERPDARDWVLDHVLPHPLTGGQLGKSWIEWTREGFPRGARRAGEQARLAAGAVALDAALAELRSPRR